MKISKFFEIVMAASLVVGMTSCGEDDKDKGGNDDNKCTATVCKDANTLSKCDIATGVATDETCANGCDASKNACKDKVDDNKCTADVCKDANTLSKCDTATGIASDEPCANGCDSSKNACKDKGDVPSDKCTADVCKTADILSKCDASTGVASDETCDYGCDPAKNACREKGTDPGEKCTENSCKDDNTLSKCDTATGTTSDEPCEYGCDSDKKACKDKPVEKCQASVCKEDKKTLVVCKEDGTTEDKTCDHACLDNDCRDEGYCSTGDDCKEEGKNFCHKELHVCTDMACSSVKCNDGESCILGICVPDADYQAKGMASCDKDAFVDHCREDKLVFCDNMGADGYKVHILGCDGKFNDDYRYGGCAVYKESGDKLKANCILRDKPDDVCGANTPSKRTCEYNDYEDNNLYVDYICTISTNAVPIAVAVDTGTTCTLE